MSALNTQVLKSSLGKAKAMMVLSSALTLLLSGCIITVKDGDYHKGWEQRQTDNREIISDLAVGTSLTEVKKEMGIPDDSESLVINGTQYKVLYYRTHHNHEDGKTTRDETTPLIFKDNVLIGWGTRMLNQIGQ